MDKGNTRVANHRIQLAKKIATGGMAEIFLGKQVGEDGFQRICAIKRILPNYAKDNEFIEMFRDEAHICKRLQHANIVRVEGFEEVEGSFAIIMEYIDGTDLRTLLAACEKNKQKMPTSCAIFICAESARGLHYAHTKIDEITNKPLDIVHRDISPQNILLTFTGEIKITDFGIADADADAKIAETKPGIVKGKYSYMSPEQIVGKPVDARADVFALGVVFWEMLAMKRLFHGKNEVETISLVRSCKIPNNLRTINPQVTEELENILLTALAKDPKNRYPSAAAFEKELRRYLNQVFPDFTSGDIGSVVRDQMKKKMEENQEIIKKVLTENRSAPPEEVQGRMEAEKTPLAFKGSNDHPSKEGTRLDASGTGVALSLNRKENFSDSSISRANNMARAGLSRAVMVQKSRNSETGFRGQAAAQPKRTPLIALVSSILIIFGLYWGQRTYFSKANSGVTLVLQTSPEIVAISLNGKRLFAGKYHSAKDLRITNLPPAKKQVISVSKEGYHSERFSFTGSAGDVIEKLDLVLQPNATFAPTTLKVATPPGKKYQYEINGGIAYGYLPDNVADLIYGQTYTIRVIDESVSKSPFMRCTFVPRSRTWRAPHVVKIDPINKSCD